MLVVAARPPTNGKCDRQMFGPPTGTTNSLLVVEPLWRHVGHDNPLECADVDASLHRCCHRQNVDLVHKWLLRVVNEDALELCLPRLCLERVGLSREFLTVEPVHTSVFRRKPGVVVVLGRHLRGIGAQFTAA